MATEAVIDIQTSNDVPAIKLDAAYKHYGSGKSRLPVLIGLNMQVERGQIYGLLGKLIHVFSSLEKIATNRST